MLEKIKIRNPFGNSYQDPYEGILEVTWLCSGTPGLGRYSDKYFMVYNEFGLTHLICAANVSDAWEEWLDNQPAIADEDLWMAYGFPSKKSYDLYCKLENEEDQETFLSSLEGFDNLDLELAEGYEYMPNFGGTNGIVDVGHYIQIAEYPFRPKKVVTGTR